MGVTRQLATSPGSSLSTSTLPIWERLFVFSKLDDLASLLNVSYCFKCPRLEFVAPHGTVPTCLPGFSFFSSDLHSPFLTRSWFSVWDQETFSAPPPHYLVCYYLLCTYCVPGYGDGQTWSLTNMELLNLVLEDDGKWDWQVQPGCGQRGCHF